MQQRAKEFVLLLSLWVGMCLVPAAAVSAQDERPREHVYLPPVSGATPLSTVIDAQAHYLVAYGDCLESMAIARRSTWRRTRSSCVMRWTRWTPISSDAS